MTIKWEYVITEVVYRKFSRPIARFLAKFNVNPTLITFIATFVGLFSGYLIAMGEIYKGVVVLFVSQILDCVDGDLARITDRVTKVGGFLDRVFDRFVDAAIIMGIIALSPSDLWLVGTLAIVGSFGVSMSRAMAEAEGAVCKVGIGGRDTRLAIIMIGLILNYYFATLLIVAILGFITTIHRIVHTLKQLVS
ncbi:MAG: CDP-alcohol phosphatidyltransferase family protein [Archaeoglobaceae archaeon]|nr:CDP-alcohol phosphatidyltransferase family protein [Archaeoglobaceae archaeon]